MNGGGSPAPAAADWYVAPDGSANGDGSILRPFSLERALSATEILPNSTIWMRGGTYTGDYTVSLAGTEGNPITIRPYNFEAVNIEGQWQLGDQLGNNSYIILRDLTFYGAETDRGGENTTFPYAARGEGVQCFSPNSQILDCKFHDCGVSIGHWTAATGTCVISGNIVLNGGWLNSDRGHGHDLYIQGAQGSTKIVTRNIFAPSFGRTLAAYGSGDNYGLNVHENIFIEEDGGNALIGSSGRSDAMVFDDNHVWGAFAAQYLGHQNGAISVQRNRLYNPATDAWAFMVGYWEAPTVRGNVVTGYSPLNDAVIKEMVRFTHPDDVTGEVIDWDVNAWHYLGEEPKPFKIHGEYKTFVEMQAAGFDAAGSYATTAPATNEVFVYPNEYVDAYTKRRGIVAIWNREALEDVTVNVSTCGLTNGTTYRLYNALNWAEYHEFVYNEGAPTVSVPMTAADWTVAKPTGWDVALVTEPFPTFGAFFLEAV